MVREPGSDGLLCSLKGAALPIFLILAREERASQPALSAEAGWGRGATYGALRRLVQAGLAAPDARGGWRLTERGAATWHGLLAAYGAQGARHRGATYRPDEVSAEMAPENGTAVHSGAGKVVPEIDTVMDREGTPAPESVTAVHREGIVAPESDSTVPEIDTGAHSEPGITVPEIDTRVPETETAVPETDTGVPEIDTGVPENGTHARDDLEHDHVVDDHYQSTDRKVIKRLRALKPRFGGAAEWLPQQNRDCVVAWLDYYDAAPPEQLAGFWNPTGMLRKSVERGIWPPALVGKGQRQKACPTCGRSMWDSDGSCLVCAGVVKT